MAMSMNEFDRIQPGDGDDQLTLFTQRYSLPADFNEEDRAFVEELYTLFAPEEEELPPYDAQTFLASTDPRYFPVETGFEQKTSARVFQRLKLRRRLFHTPHAVFSPFIYGMSSIYTRLSL